MELIGRSAEELVEIARQMGEKPFRGRQLAEWLYRHGARSLDAMTTLPAAFRQALAQTAVHPLSRVAAQSPSTDGTVKFLLELGDGNSIECVFLPYEDRTTLCVSTQVGCAMGCAFCATAMGGLKRGLTAGEIVDQVLCAQSETGRRITNVVYMGMGEPLANYGATVRSIRLLAGEVGISARKITVSTVGLTQGIRSLAAEGLPVTLAISLHAPEDALRARIMPAAAKHPLPELLRACREYASVTGRRVTFEYLLLDGVNSSREQARQLAHLLHGMLANVNIIPYNHVEGRGDFRRPPRPCIDAFKDELQRAGVTVTERMRRGNPVSAACGQLRLNQDGGAGAAAASGKDIR